jgi:hypothetical protein
MVDDATLQEYLVPAPDTFWEWRDGGEVISWKDGTTIAFRDELRAVLSWLAPYGLPSMDSIALLLSATHDVWNDRSAQEHMLADLLTEPSARRILGELLRELDRVNELSRELRATTRAKSVLADMCLSGCRRVAEQDVAMSIVESLHRGLGELVEQDSPELDSRGYGPLLLARDIADMLPALRRLDADSLQLRINTGIDALPAPAEADLAPDLCARALIDSLQDDPELAGIARVAKQLFAAASLPRRLDTQEQYHTGGFSDISNRGSMERLLITELANDDLTLAVRVAMNEALYLRREVPPSTPHHHRAVLIDSGIRSWGTPRVFAAAVALAFMASTSHGASYSCFRARRDSMARVDLTTRHGLQGHLSVLESDLHLAGAIPAFFKQLESDDITPEPILLMTDDALRDPAVQQALHQVKLPQVFIATANRDGDFRLFERVRYGMKPLREARIDLASLVPEPKALIDHRESTQWPAILDIEPFPLLLSHSVEWDRAFYIHDWGVVSSTGDGRLLRWQHVGRGATQLSDRIVGRILWVSPTATDGDISLVVGGSTNASLLRVNRDNVVVQSLRLKLCLVGSNYCERSGVLFLIRQDTVDALSMVTGEEIQSLKLSPKLRWKHDRFFCNPNQTEWYALSYDGHTARLERVQCAGDRRTPPLLITMFDQAGVDGPIGVTTEGDLFSTATGNLRKVRHNLNGPLEVTWIAADGNRLRLRSTQPTTPLYHGILLNTQHLGFVAANHGFLEDRAQKLVRQTNLRYRFKSIGIDLAGNLALESRKGHLLVFEVRQGLPVIASRQGSADLRDLQPFDSIDHFDRNYRLWEAVWPDGSRAVLDSRGLLHLRSSDESIPQFTLVLSEGELSGWTATKRCWGNAYYVGDAGRANATAAQQYAIFVSTVGRFVERLHA